MDHYTSTIDLAGRPLTVDIGRVARQAGGSVLIRYGDTVCLVTATASREARPDLDFFPLRVDFEERLYAAGRIPGSFFRREGRPTERAILAGRLIDRPIRPLFPEGMRNDVQVICTVLSYDDDHLPEIAGIIGASLALQISPIPFNGPMAGVSVGLVDGQLIINPTHDQRDASDLHMVVAGTPDAVVMIEAEANQVPESVILDAIEAAHVHIKELCRWQVEIAAAIGQEKMEITRFIVPDEIKEAVEQAARDEMLAAMRQADKTAREEAISQVKEKFQEELLEQFPEEEKAIKAALNELERTLLRDSIVREGIRPDGRGPRDIRPIWCQVGMLPRVHGAGLFTRGQTQVLTVASLGAVGDRQMLDSLGHIEEFKRYMHHYNFPPYSVGEVRPIFGPGRREVGHGALAERALLPVLPDEETFPYTIRLVSEVLESNGSSSMASVCGSTLALMDAGVPLAAPVAGIAMGLIKEGDQVVVLTDILGVEDFLGDMDFKVAGTSQGITAIQMDTKVAGLSRAIMEEALAQAREGRLFILEKMAEVIAEPRPELSPYAPRIIVMQIDPDRIRDVIGPGGKMINKIIKECKVEIDIEDDGRVFIASYDAEGGARAKQWIEQLTREVEVGEIFLGQVTRMLNFGAFVELFPGKEGLVHISQLANERVPRVEDFVQVGDTIAVKVVEIDDMGRVNLSRRDVVNADPGIREQENITGPMAALLDVEPGAVRSRAPADNGRGDGRGPGRGRGPGGRGPGGRGPGGRGGRPGGPPRNR
ncbi:MAG TPA: polyribonucleotide nucleotidyltransferase [Sphingobacteriaceae bacterium]|nr:polyribonucleotide nucleotidyltransferase [Sphingobacteriaceae bacterium]